MRFSFLFDKKQHFQIIFFSMILCFGFVGCARESAPPTSTELLPDSTSSASSNAEIVKEEGGTLRVYNHMTVTQNGYYTSETNLTNGNNIIYIDFATAQKTVLCSQPGCLHNDETCTGWLAYSTNIMLNDNKLILMHGESIDSSGNTTAPYIETADFSGQNRKTIFTFDTGVSPSQGYAADNNYIYTIVSTLSADGYSISNYQLLRIDIAEGTAKVLEEYSPDSGMFLTGAYDGNLVLKEITTELFDEDIILETEEDWVDVFSRQEHRISIYNIATGESKLVKTWLQDTAAEYYEDSNMYLAGSDGSVRYFDFITEAETIISDENETLAGLNVTIDGKLNRYLLLSSRRMDSNNESVFTNYTYNLDTGAFVEHHLTMINTELATPISVITTYGDSVLVINSRPFVQQQISLPNGSVTNVDTLVDKFAFISVDDFVSNTPNYTEIAEIN